MFTKTCHQCGNQFTTRDRPAKFCSRACANAAKTHERVMRTCPTCGKQFPINPKHPDVKSCSQKCSGVLRQTLQVKTCSGCGTQFRERYVGQKFCSAECGFKFRKPREITHLKVCICEWCGKTFETRHDAPGRFCSHQCTSEYAATQPPKGIRKPEIHITLTCKVCGKPYQTTTHQVRERGSSCCSRECVAILQSQLKRKEGNPNYRGGTIIYRGANWGTQSRKALKRDGHKCQICGKKVGRHKADYGIHHIKPFRQFGDDYLTANQLSNLITLCRSCHARVEYGDLSCPRPLPFDQ